MSLYTHRCETCGHRAYEHSEGRCEWDASCPCTRLEYGPTVLVPTFDSNGEEVARIIPPGDGIRGQARLAQSAPDENGAWVWAHPGNIIVPSCDCNECQLAYRAAEAAS